MTGSTTTRRAALRALVSGVAAAGGASAFGAGPLFGAARASSAAASTLPVANAPAAGVARRAMRLVAGAAPAGLEGALYRNGPGQMRRGDQFLGHWFDGDGFVRAFRIADGAASLEGRFVDTPKRRMDDAAGAFAASGFGTRGLPDAPVANNDDVNAANTALLDVGDEIWALWEAGSPYRIDPADLSARGPVTFRNDLRHMPFSAHPKVEPGGRVWNFGLAYGRPSSIIWALAPDGSLERAELIDLPRTSYLHDWAVSETKLIFPLQPWVSARQRPPFVTSLKWRPEDGMQILVVDKDDFSKRRIFDAPAAFFFHTGDAYEERDGTIRFDACFGDGPVLGPEDGARIVRGLPLTGPTAQMAAMTLRPDGTVRYERTGEPAEFPVTDRRRQGRAHGAVWSVTEDGAVGDAPYTFNGVMRTDWNSGGVDRFFFGADRLAEEHVFVPRPGATGERDGWLVGAWLNVAERATELAVFDAARLADGPLAVWRSDVALPIGFHGLWRGA